MTRVRLPGLVDVHVHLREPGETHKESFATGTAAALAGGVTTVLAMPNTKPPITNTEVLAHAAERVNQTAHCDVGLFVGATADNAQEAAGLAGKAIGLKIYLDATYGPLRVNDYATLLKHFRAWPAERPIAVHAEELSLPLAVGLAWAHGKRLHVCHVSRREELAFIRAAKERGAPVTCEVTPHHLFLEEGDVARLGTFGQMRPPLATADDRVGLWELLDVVDCVATDHAPHTVEEKRGGTPPPGVPGVETMLPLMLTTAAEGRLTLDRVVELLHTRPRQIFGLAEQAETVVEVDTAERYTLPSEGWQTRCGWNPFAGQAVTGRVRRVTLRGKLVYDDGRVLALAGDGRFIRPQ